MKTNKNLRKGLKSIYTQYFRAVKKVCRARHADLEDGHVHTAGEGRGGWDGLGD